MIPTRIVIHCTASPNGKPITVESIRQDHIKNRKFKDIGYHCVITVDGKSNKGRIESRTGAHATGWNRDSLGVCLVGTNKFNVAQFVALREVVERWCGKYKIKPDQVFAHYQVPSAKKQGKTCPNVDIEDLKDWIFEANPEKIRKYLLNGK